MTNRIADALTRGTKSHKTILTGLRRDERLAVRKLNGRLTLTQTAAWADELREIRCTIRLIKDAVQS